MSQAIDIRDLRKVYQTRRGRIEALRGLDMEVRTGEIYGFIGVNGAGKSTTIKSLMGLITPSSGQATIFGSPCGSMEARTKLGYLPEVATYHEFMSADELLAVHARLARVPRDKQRQRCDAALEAVGLGARRKSRLSEFSKGMKQRFGIAQALVADPPLLVLDELTSGLDPFAQIELKAIMLDLKRRGITIFFSSHQMSEVETVCDRAGIIHRGKMRAQGTLDELLSTRGQDELELSLSPEGAAGLKERYPLESLAQEGKYRVWVPAAQTNACIDAVRGAQGSIVSLKPARAHLEEVFHDLVVAVDKEEAAV